MTPTPTSSPWYRLVVSAVAAVAALGFAAGAPEVAAGEDGPSKDPVMVPLRGAWYRAAPAATSLCSVPHDLCGDDFTAPPSTDEADDMLHVGVTGGIETDRSFLELGLAELVPSAQIAGAELIIPLAGADAGTSAPETAMLLVCPSGPITEDAHGRVGTGPAIDCKEKVTAIYEAPADGGDGAGRFVADLTPVAHDWTAGADATVALVPAPTAEQTTPATWHLAFTTQHGEETDPVSASVVVMTSPVPSTGTAVGTPPSSSSPAADHSLDAGLLHPGDAPPPQPESGTSNAAPPAPAATEPAVAARRGPRGALVTVGFAYPEIFLLPLLGLVAGGVLTRALVSEVTGPAVERH